MKRTIPLAALAFLALLALGCASEAPSPQPSDIWPKIWDDETYLSDFGSAWSEDEAVGAIKNLRDSMVESRSSLPFSSLDVDPYGMRARWSWVEEGGYQKSSGFIIPFDQVSSVLLERYPALGKDMAWGILTRMSDGSAASVRMQSRDSAERLGRAIVALAKARKAPLSLPDPRFGAALSALSPEQAAAAGIQASAGVIVQWVFKESPAEKAGFSAQDIITQAGGKALRSTDDLFAAISAASAAGAAQLRIDGIRRSYRTGGGLRTEVFVPLSYSLGISGAAQGGGAE